MKRGSGPLVAFIAAVTVAAVVLGGTLASRRGPHSDNVAAAAPLTPTVPTKVTLALNDLGTGQLPQVPYVVGREVRGGAGSPIEVPGNDDILEIARVNNSVLALTTNGNGWFLHRLDANGTATIAAVNHVEVSENRRGAAYAAYGGGLPPTEGGTIYADSGTSLRSLKLTTGWNFKVLAYATGKVYYQSSDVLGSGATWSTYVWTPGEPKAALVKTIPFLNKMTADGKTAASTVLENNTGSCSSINVVDTGLRVWKTCDYSLDDFSPSGATVYGVPSRDQGACITAEAALDAKSARLLREWKGCLQSAAPEDEDHLLMVASAGAGKSAIVRCSVSGGNCELATPVAADKLVLSR